MLSLLALCLYHLYMVFFVADHGDLILTDPEAQERRCLRSTMILMVPGQEFGKSMHMHLVAWQELAHLAGEKGLFLFYLRPKHHYMMHLGEQVLRCKVNPRRAMTCSNDESFLGYIKQTGVRCHKAAVNLRVLQRYALFLELRWQEAALLQG